MSLAAELATRHRFTVQEYRQMAEAGGTDPSGEPQPDLTLLGKDRTRGRIPAASDTALVVEVSDSSLRYDREVKAPLYARAGIPELWIVNLLDDVVEVSPQPGPEGYGATIRFPRGQRVDSPTLPGISFDAEELLPPRT